ncbi:MAG: DUF4286 family protein [Schleiferiaceae bacterium]|jgi:hypothetical protein|nr:DUF4286 family protein [Schleiferiaceae bacterium]
MIIYNVTVNIDDSIREEWIAWMKDVHIPAVMETGMFINNRFCKVLVEEESGTTYSIQYQLKDMEAFQLYQELYAAQLQKEHKEKYEGRFVAFRTLLEQIDETHYTK